MHALILLVTNLKTEKMMKKIFKITTVLAFLLAVSLSTNAQSKSRVSKEKDEPVKVFEVVEQMPEFPGGPAALTQWLNDHIKYPAIATDNNIQGRVLCTFTVERDGSITNVGVLKSVDPALDKEAIRVLKSMPKWYPGKQNGTHIRVKYTASVEFEIRGLEAKEEATPFGETIIFINEDQKDKMYTAEFKIRIFDYSTKKELTEPVYVSSFTSKDQAMEVMKKINQLANQTSSLGYDYKTVAELEKCLRRDFRRQRTNKRGEYVTTVLPGMAVLFVTEDYKTKMIEIESGVESYSDTIHVMRIPTIIKVTDSMK